MTVGESKLPSKVIRLKVESDKNESNQQTGFPNYAVRPNDSFPFEESSFQSG